MRTKILTNVFIVADLSGSMSMLEKKQQDMIADYLSALADIEAQGDQEFNCTLLGFSGIVMGHIGPETARGCIIHDIVKRLTLQAPGMGSQTALRDAIGVAIDLANQRSLTPTLIQVFTDGGENMSWAWSAQRLEQAIRQAEARGNVTFAIAGPKEAVAMLKQYGIPADSFRCWDGTEKELAAVRHETVAAVQTYTTERAAGKTKSVRFYADPSNLTSSGVRGFTKEVKPEIQAVTKRMAGRSIADFYGAKFKPGNHYYQLIKPEYLQEDKELVVHIKADNEYRLGSRSVRQLLGLPEMGKIRVHPGPHSDKFDLFVQSSSVNRKVVEGQLMLSIEE